MKRYSPTTPTNGLCRYYLREAVATVRVARDLAFTFNDDEAHAHCLQILESFANRFPFIGTDPALTVFDEDGERDPDGSAEARVREPF